MALDIVLIVGGPGGPGGMALDIGWLLGRLAAQLAAQLAEIRLLILILVRHGSVPLPGARDSMSVGALQQPYSAAGPPRKGLADSGMVGNPTQPAQLPGPAPRWRASRRGASSGPAVTRSRNAGWSRASSRTGVSAVTVALRGAPVSRPSSPKASSGPRLRSRWAGSPGCSERLTSTVPL